MLRTDIVGLRDVLVSVGVNQSANTSVRLLTLFLFFPLLVVTTMGVGELSAINGVAGAYAENVKLIHIVGTTGMKAQEARAMIHHSLGPRPDHRVLKLVLLQPQVSADTTHSGIRKDIRVC